MTSRVEKVEAIQEKQQLFLQNFLSALLKVKPSDNNWGETIISLQKELETISIKPESNNRNSSELGNDDIKSIKSELKIIKEKVAEDAKAIHKLENSNEQHNALWVQFSSNIDQLVFTNSVEEEDVEDVKIRFHENIMKLVQQTEPNTNSTNDNKVTKKENSEKENKNGKMKCGKFNERLSTLENAVTNQMALWNQFTTNLNGLMAIGGEANDEDAESIQDLIQIRDEFEKNVKNIIGHKGATSGDNENILCSIHCIKHELKKLKKIKAQERLQNLEDSSSVQNMLFDDFQSKSGNGEEEDEKSQDLDDVRNNFKRHISDLVGLNQVKETINDLKTTVETQSNKISQFENQNFARIESKPADVIGAKDSPVNSAVVPNELVEKISKQESDLELIKTMLKNQAALWTEFETTIQALVNSKVEEESSSDAIVEPNTPPQSLHDQIRCLKYEIKKVRQEISAFTEKQALLENNNVEKRGKSYRSSSNKKNKNPSSQKVRSDEKPNSGSENEDSSSSIEEQPLSQEEFQEILSELVTRFDELTADFADLRSRADSSLQITDAELLSRIQNISLVDRVTKLEKTSANKIASIMTEQMNVSSSIEKINENLNSLISQKQEIIELSQDLINKEIGNIGERLGDNETTLSDIRQTIQQNTTDIYNLTSNLSPENCDYATKEQTESISSQIEKYQKSISEKITKIEENVDSLGTKLDNQDDQIKLSAVDKQLNESKEMINSVEAKINQLESKLTEKVETVQSGVKKTVDDTVEDFERKLSGLNINIENVDQLSDILRSLKHEIKSLLSPTSKSNSLIDDLSSKYESIHSNVECLKHEIEDVKSLSATIQERSVNLSLETEQKNEAEAEKIQKDVKDLNDAVKELRERYSKYDELKKIVMNDHRDMKELKAINYNGQPIEGGGFGENGSFKGGIEGSSSNLSNHTFDDLSPPSSPIQIKSILDGPDDFNDAFKTIVNEQNRQKKLTQKLTDAVKSGEVRHSQLNYQGSMIQELRNKTTQQGDLITNLIKKQSDQETALSRITQTVRFFETLNIENEIEGIKKYFNCESMKKVGSLDALAQIVVKNKGRIAELGKLYNSMDDDFKEFQQTVDEMKHNVKKAERRLVGGSNSPPASPNTSNIAPRSPTRSPIAAQTATIARVLSSVEDSKTNLSSEPSSMRRKPKSPQSKKKESK